MTLSVVIPVYNERQTIREILAKVGTSESLGLSKEIIVVDDGSTDGTREILKEVEQNRNPSLRLFCHPRNEGKGAALNTAFRQATGDFLIIQDADLEYDPTDYPRLLEPLLKRTASVVYGSRLKNLKFALWGKEATPLPFHYLANRFLSWLTGLLFHTQLTDMETGYKVLSREVYQNLQLVSKRFECEPEMTAKILHRGYRILEVPIVTKPRGYKEGKKIAAKDGFLALWALVRFRLQLKT